MQPEKLTENPEITQPKTQPISIPEKTPKEIILETIFADGQNIFDLKDAKMRVNFLIDMLTATQKKEVAKKVVLCGFYIEKLKAGMTLKKLRSLIYRRFNKHPKSTIKACEPCEVAAKGLLK